MSEITVREIAAAIQRPDEKLPNVVDRVRNWTDEDLLMPLGEKNPGTGKHRIYPREAIAEALILSILTDAAGMQAVKGPVGRLFKVIRRSGLEKRIWSTAAAGQSFLMVGLTRDALPEATFCKGQGLASEIGRSAHDSHVVIDLWKLKYHLHSLGYRDGESP